MTKNQFGVFEIVVPAKVNGQTAIPHNSKLKVRAYTARLMASSPGSSRYPRLYWFCRVENASTAFRPGSST